MTFVHSSSSSIWEVPSSSGSSFGNLDLDCHSSWDSSSVGDDVESGLETRSSVLGNVDARFLHEYFTAPSHSAMQTKANGVAWREHWNVWNVIGYQEACISELEQDLRDGSLVIQALTADGLSTHGHLDTLHSVVENKYQELVDASFRIELREEIICDLHDTVAELREKIASLEAEVTWRSIEAEVRAEAGVRRRAEQKLAASIAIITLHRLHNKVIDRLPVQLCDEGRELCPTWESLKSLPLDPAIYDLPPTSAARHLLDLVLSATTKTSRATKFLASACVDARDGLFDSADFDEGEDLPKPSYADFANFVRKVGRQGYYTEEMGSALVWTVSDRWLVGQEAEEVMFSA